MTTTTSNNDMQLKTTLVHQSMTIIHNELEDTYWQLEHDDPARRWRGSNIVMKRQLSARARDIVERQWNPIGVVGSSEYQQHFRDLVALYKTALQDEIIYRMNSGQSPHTSDESPPASDGSDDSESDDGGDQGLIGHVVPKMTNATVFHIQAQGKFY
ncbi:unnamed protein product [Cyclocybe aegerita]|uniref:Uncharacterized protein n=1 Tax=Cyclocybe aegerita TaxID=1973307 RepID=A0A8S0W164_CYCAE|nr:unnamed protein product [Cyclocybe aegerita]